MRCYGCRHVGLLVAKDIAMPDMCHLLALTRTSYCLVTPFGLRSRFTHGLRSFVRVWWIAALAEAILGCLTT